MTHFTSLLKSFTTSQFAQRSGKRLIGTGCILTLATLSLLGGCRQSSDAEVGGQTLEGSALITNNSDPTNIDESSPTQAALPDDTTADNTPVANTPAPIVPAPINFAPEREAPTREYGLRPLNTREIEEYSDHTYSIFSDHSFHLTYPDIGEADFLAVEQTATNGLPSLQLSVFSQDGENYRLPAHHSGHYLTELKAVSFKNIDANASHPDIVVIAEYITGIGPSGTEPFPVTAVYTYLGNGQYAKDAALSEMLTNQGTATIADAMAAINALDEI